MDKIRNMTINELEEIGYKIEVIKHAYRNVEDALEDMKDVMDEGEEVKFVDMEGDLKWLTKTEGGVEVTHFIDEKERMEEPPKVTRNLTV